MVVVATHRNQSQSKLKSCQLSSASTNKLVEAHVGGKASFKPGSAVFSGSYLSERYAYVRSLAPISRVEDKIETLP